MLVVVNFANTKGCKKAKTMCETFACGYSSESSHQELSNKYQYYRVQMFFKILYILDLSSLSIGRVNKWFTALYVQLKGVSLINGFSPYMYN